MEQVRSRKKAESQSTKLFRVISENPGFTAQEISQNLGWTQSKTNRMITTLEKKGWVVRRTYSAAQPKMIAKPDETVQRLNSRFVRLASWKARLEEREKELFEKVVSMKVKGDQVGATMYANQCAEVRKIIRLVDDTEQVLSRLSTPE